MAEPLQPTRAMYDVLIVGGGPAGLSAALVLGRCRRRVLVCDAGAPRNAVATALHGYLTRDGIPPLELLRVAREELQQYGVELRALAVTDIERRDDGFDIAVADGARERAHAVLLATGVHDDVPEVPGIAECYGISVHHCPYCDGWEHRDGQLAVMGPGPAAAGLALSLRTWSARVVVCTGGPARLKRGQREQLDTQQIRVREDRFERIAHANGRVREILFAHGDAVPCDGIFFTGSQRQQSDLPRRLGCEFTRRGTVHTDHLGETCVPGVYVVGDASRDVQFVIVAAAEGAKAGVAINRALQARSGLTVQSV